MLFNLNLIEIEPNQITYVFVLISGCPSKKLLCHAREYHINRFRFCTEYLRFICHNFLMHIWWDQSSFAKSATETLLQLPRFNPTKKTKKSKRFTQKECLDQNIQRQKRTEQLQSTAKRTQHHNANTTNSSTNSRFKNNRTKEIHNVVNLISSSSDDGIRDFENDSFNITSDEDIDLDMSYNTKLLDLFLQNLFWFKSYLILTFQKMILLLII